MLRVSKILVAIPQVSQERRDQRNQIRNMPAGEARFWAWYREKLDQNQIWPVKPNHPKDACILWTAGASEEGYARGKSLLQKQDKAGKEVNDWMHRETWSLLHGPIPANPEVDPETGEEVEFKLEVDHKCQFARCINPWHLNLTTRLANGTYLVEKRRLELESKPAEEQKAHWETIKGHYENILRAINKGVVPPASSFVILDDIVELLPGSEEGKVRKRFKPNPDNVTNGLKNGRGGGEAKYYLSLLKKVDSEFKDPSPEDLIRNKQRIEHLERLIAKEDAKVQALLAKSAVA